MEILIKMAKRAAYFTDLVQKFKVDDDDITIQGTNYSFSSLSN